MSRSYRKKPVRQLAVKWGPRYAKRHMNRLIRRCPLDSLPKKGNSFKDVFLNPWDRCDHFYQKTFKEYYEKEIRDYYQHYEAYLGNYNWGYYKKEPPKYPDRQEIYNEWAKFFIRK